MKVTLPSVGSSRMAAELHLSSDRRLPEQPDLQQPNAIRFSPDGASLPAHITAWISGQDASVVTLSSADELMAIGLRARPRFALFDARKDPKSALAALHRMKRDSYTAVVPCAAICG